MRVSKMHNRFYTAVVFAAFPFVGVILSSVLGDLFTQSPTSGWHRYDSPLAMISFAAWQAPFSALMGAMLAGAFISLSRHNYIITGARYGITIAFFSGIAASAVFELHGTNLIYPSLVGAIRNFTVIYVSLGLHLFTGAIAGIIVTTHANKCPLDAIRTN